MKVYLKYETLAYMLCHRQYLKETSEHILLTNIVVNTIHYFNYLPPIFNSMQSKMKPPIIAHKLRYRPAYKLNHNEGFSIFVFITRSPENNRPKPIRKIKINSKN